MKNISLIGVPFKAGCDRNGAQYAPIFFRSQRDLRLESMHIAPIDDISQISPAWHRVNNYDAIVKVNTIIKDYVSNELYTENPICVVGGDHSIALGSISAILENNPNTAIIWFDAHTDINTEETSPSGNAHGMPLAALLGLCQSINITEAKLKPNNIFWIGARSIDEGEQKIIDELGIASQIYTDEDVHNIGMKGIFNIIRTKLLKNNVENVHISFDVDGMSTTVISATGTPVSGGVTDEEFEDFVNECAELPIHTMDFVEYNPLLDERSEDGIWCVYALNRLLNLLK